MLFILFTPSNILYLTDKYFESYQQYRNFAGNY